MPVCCMTSTLAKKIDALDNWCLNPIQTYSLYSLDGWTDSVSNDVVRSRTGQSLLSDTIRRRRLSFVGHLCRNGTDTSQDHSRVLQACIHCILDRAKDWRCRTGRPKQTWLSTEEDKLRRLSFSLATARRRALDRSTLRQLMEAATSVHGWHAPERESMLVENRSIL